MKAQEIYRFPIFKAVLGSLGQLPGRPGSGWRRLHATAPHTVSKSRPFWYVFQMKSDVFWRSKRGGTATRAVSGSARAAASDVPAAPGLMGGTAAHAEARVRPGVPRVTPGTNIGLLAHSGLKGVMLDPEF